MRQFKLSVSEYREKITQDEIARFGWADPGTIEPKVKRYALARQQYKQQLQNPVDFNPFTDDPNCPNCGKNKKKVDVIENPVNTMESTINKKGILEHIFSFMQIIKNRFIKITIIPLKAINGIITNK